MDVRPRDDLHERRAAAVEVHVRVRSADDAAGGATDVDRLRRVLLEMCADDSDGRVTVGARNYEGSVRAERLVVLGDLVALRIVRIEVVLAVEDGVLRDVTVEREPELDRPLDRQLVRNRQRTGVCEADRTGLRVRCTAEAVGAAAEHLRPRLQLDVDLEADDGLPLVTSHVRGTPSPSATAPRCRRAPRRPRAIP